ncbi:HU family DNA-binding protein [Sphaerisporangium album]|uniref:HU family DNA-binding protein n=1 Tax=Sphaerisporangium album TaxID=509200 RepID=A0A367ENZ7_9ACTN|nr:HU family DNA-binding protein [Sphaerisporangium album]RCG19137.1 HU family DNA-binding protein [Sphaerisporangium album]
MKKAELIAKAAATSSDLAKAASQKGLTPTQIDLALKSLTTALQEAVAAGERVDLPGLGVFERKTRAARTGRNPQTGDAMAVAAKNVPIVRLAKAFKDAVAAGV